MAAPHVLPRQACAYGYCKAATASVCIRVLQSCHSRNLLLAVERCSFKNEKSRGQLRYKYLFTVFYHLKTKVPVNQSIWDHLTPAVRSQDVRLQKVQTSIFKGICALTTMIDKCLDHIPPLQNENDLLQLATDALALFANANSELNQRLRELVKPDLHDEYKHLCSSSLAITDQLFGDDLPKQVKELTEVSRVGKKLSTHTGRSTAKLDYRRHNLYAHGRGRPRYQHCRKPFFGLVEKRPQTSSDFQEKEGGEVNVTLISNNIDIEVRNRSEQSVDIIGGRLKQFASQWQCMTSDPFILYSVKHYKIEFENGEPHQCMPPKEINFTR